MTSPMKYTDGITINFSVDRFTGSVLLINSIMMESPMKKITNERFMFI